MNDISSRIILLSDLVLNMFPFQMLVNLMAYCKSVSLFHLRYLKASDTKMNALQSTLI